MRPIELSKRLNIADVTLRHWAGKDYAEFLSPSAQGLNGARRSFSDQDARIIGWVAILKNQNVPHSEIVATLRSARGQNWRGLPELPGALFGDEPVAMVPREAVEERVRGLQTHYEHEIQILQTERDLLKTRLEETHHSLEIARRELGTAKEQGVETTRLLQERITTLSTQEAELRGQLDQYSMGGKRRGILTIVTVAVLTSVLLTALFLLGAFLLAAHLVKP